MARGARQATVHGVAESDMTAVTWHTHIYIVYIYMCVNIYVYTEFSSHMYAVCMCSIYLVHI